jgi:hypothetical protein
MVPVVPPIVPCGVLGRERPETPRRGPTAVGGPPPPLPLPVGSNEPISTRQIGGKTRYQAKRVAEIGGDAAVAFAEGCSFSICESETRDWAVVWRATSLVEGKRDLVEGKTKCGRLFWPLGWPTKETLAPVRPV